jgi:hypothetical protein
MAVGDQFIRVERVRAAMRLVGEVREIGTGTEPGRRHLVDGLAGLLGCAIGGAVRDTGYAPGLKGGIAEATLTGFDRQIIDVFETHHTEGSDFNPFHGALMRRMTNTIDDVLTSTESEIVARREWEGSAWINEYVRPARVDHFVGSVRIVGETECMGCGFMRAGRTSASAASSRRRRRASCWHRACATRSTYCSPARPTRRSPQSSGSARTPCAST